jgi:hypothetical protein
MGLYVTHDTDWAGQTYDLINLYHRSAGDALFIAHQGGTPLGYSGPPPGGQAGVNVLVPYYKDDTSTGRKGTVVNANRGQKGLHIETQAVVDGSVAIDIQHFSNAYAMYMIVQPPNYQPAVGTGGAIYIDDYSGSPTMLLCKWKPGAALQVHDANGTLQAQLQSNGTMALGSNVNLQNVQYQGWSNVAGFARGIALVNTNASPGVGTQIEFDGGDYYQYALIQATYDQRNSGSLSSSLTFQVRSANQLTPMLALSGSGIGFFGAQPAARPTVRGSRGGNGALASLISSLASLGLITDNTTG